MQARRWSLWEHKHSFATAKLPPVAPVGDEDALARQAPLGAYGHRTVSNLSQTS